MNKRTKQAVGVSSALVIGVLAIYGFQTYIDSREASITDALATQITKEKADLIETARAAAQGISTPATAQIVRTCTQSNRSRFDTLLNQLGQLSAGELAEAEQLYLLCGRTFAEQKAISALVLQESVATVRHLYDSLAILSSPRANELITIVTWEDLAALEAELAALAIRQADIQGEIIELLRADVPRTDEALTTLQREAREVNERSLVLSTQAQSIRDQLY